MMFWKYHRICLLTFSAMFFFLSTGCSKKSVPYDKNLLKNPSFEEFDGNVPKGWKLGSFHGLKDEKEVEYGMSSEAHEGKKSFYFKGEEDTKRWYVLSQEVKVSETTHIHIKGRVKQKDVIRSKGQYARCGFFLILFDKHHNRFQELRFADKLTKTKIGTKDWYIEDQIYRIPRKTAYITFGCVLGMQGTVWFDNVSVMVPEPLPWKESGTKNFNFYSLPEKDFPKGANATQQDLLGEYCKVLNIKSDIRISYFYYPDSASIRELLSISGTTYVNWGEKEIHTIKPIVEHEVIHFITDEYGRPPRAIAEGSASFLMNRMGGKPVHAKAKQLLFRNEIPQFKEMLDYGSLVRLDMRSVILVTGSFVGYLYEVWGPDRLLDLFREASGSNTYTTFSTAFEKVYRIPLSEVVKRWKIYLSKVRVESEPEDTTEAE